MGKNKYVLDPVAKKDIYPEGAQAFRAQIEPFLAKWQKKHPGEKPVFFHIGEPSELPPKIVLDEAENIYHKRSKPDFSYQPVTGTLAIREAVAGHLDRSGVCFDSVTAEQIIVSGPGKLTFNAVGLALRKPGLVIALLSPTYPGNAAAAMKAHSLPASQTQKHGLVGIPVREENNWRPDPDELTEILNKTQPGLLILCNPQNPTGGAFDKKTAQPLIKYLQKHPEAIILEDGMYHKFVYDKDQYVSLASIKEIKDQVIFGDGASKDLRFTGARISWLRFPDALAEIKDAVAMQLNDLVSCAPSAECTALIPGLSEKGDRDIDQTIKIYKHKKDLIVKAFNQIGLTCNSPIGAFYLMVRTPKGISGSKLAEFAAQEAGVTLLPTVYFGASVDNQGKPIVADIYGKPLFDPKVANKYVRVSYVGDIEKMLMGVKRLGEALKKI